MMARVEELTSAASVSFSGAVRELAACWLVMQKPFPVAGRPPAQTVVLQEARPTNRTGRGRMPQAGSLFSGVRVQRPGIKDRKKGGWRIGARREYFFWRTFLR
jgi:hypothetical protein